MNIACFISNICFNVRVKHIFFSNIKIWDYQTNSCVTTLRGHTNNVSAVLFHPQLPIIVSGSEDGTVRIWHSSTHRLENTLNYGMGRVWALSAIKGSHTVSLGYDDGTIMIKLGHEEPVVSMEKGGKIVWAKNHDILGVNVKRAEAVDDGEVLPLATKELGSCEVYPQQMMHSPNGRLLVCLSFYFCHYYFKFIGFIFLFFLYIYIFFILLFILFCYYYYFLVCLWRWRIHYLHSTILKEQELRPCVTIRVG